MAVPAVHARTPMPAPVRQQQKDESRHGARILGRPWLTEIRQQGQATELSTAPPYLVAGQPRQHKLHQHNCYDVRLPCRADAVEQQWRIKEQRHDRQGGQQAGCAQGQPSTPIQPCTGQQAGGPKQSEAEEIGFWCMRRQQHGWPEGQRWACGGSGGREGGGAGNYGNL